VSLDRAWIAAHIPHQGNMCLLDQVLDWDCDRITCTSSTHRALDHPLRAHDRLGAACALEYAAQAMAVHGALAQPRAPGAAGFGLLTSARGLHLYVARLDDVEGELCIRAERAYADARAALYDFTVHAARGLLAQGRASLLLDPGSAPVKARGGRA
jgi:predicted hotdog family 3-hydroxylacyl-ACP dehydratase